MAANSGDRREHTFRPAVILSERDSELSASSPCILVAAAAAAAAICIALIVTSRQRHTLTSLG